MSNSHSMLLNSLYIDSMKINNSSLDNFDKDTTLNKK